MTNAKDLYYVKWYEWDHQHKEQFPLRTGCYGTFEEAKKKYHSIICNENIPRVEIRKETILWVTDSDVRLLMKESTPRGVKETIGQ